MRGDFPIDDRPDIDGESGTTPAWEHILFDAPYNRRVLGKKRLKQWDDRKEVLQPIPNESLIGVNEFRLAGPKL
jgi:5'-nucleotidase